MVAETAEITAAGFLELVGDPLRWALLGALAGSDRRVGELTTATGKQQSLVSYHLGQLRAAGLVSARRSSADGRDTYYRAELGRCRDLFTRATAALHPGLQLQHVTPAPARRPGGRKPRVLFLCTGNSARSQMAEALLERRSEGTIVARSAGSHPKPLHPNAVRVMAERGIDIAGTTQQARVPVRTLPLRPGHHAVRQGQGDLPGVPRPAHDRALEHGGSVIGRRRRPRDLPGVRPHRGGDRGAGRSAHRPSHRHVYPRGAHMNDETVNVRYMVDDVAAALDFYTSHFGFETLTVAAPAFADVSRGNLRLLLSGPASSAGRPMPDGARPGPGGWNRIHFVTSDLDGEVARLRSEGVRFRNDVVSGPGGRQILVEDPSGNLIELFQPAAG